MRVHNIQMKKLYLIFTQQYLYDDFGIFDSIRRRSGKKNGW